MKLRGWQEELLPSVVDAVRKGNAVALAAPTGSGKTMLSLAAALELGFSVTAFVRSKSQFQAWFRDSAEIGDGRSVSVLVGQGDACHLSEGNMVTPAPCDLCKLNRPLGRRPHSADERLRPAQLVRSLMADASSEGACAYRTLATWSQEAWLLVASYPYLLSPSVRKAIDQRLSQTMVIVDEAHNLDSAAEEYSLGRGLLDGARRQARSQESKGVISELLRIMRAEQDWLEVERPTHLASYADAIKEDAESLYKSMMQRERVRSNYLRALAEFLERVSDSRFKLYSGYGELRLIDPDPASVLSALSAPRAVILMSATLPSPEYIERVWGIGRKVVYLEGRPGWGRRLYVMPPSASLTTRYRDRSDAMWDLYSNEIRGIWGSAFKSVLVVCPSYGVVQELASRLADLPTLVESRGTRAESVEEELRDGRRLVIAVARGKLVEGVEFRGQDGGSLLSDIAIAGIPYKQPDVVEEERAKRIAERAKLDDRAKWFLLQLVPAWQAVAQAAGRAVRSERDEARLWLLDERFSERWWASKVASLGHY